MDANQFLAEFGHIANAPGGIARLRELVYQFAVTGKLTQQREEDGGADSVLTNVARIRKQLIAEKKFKRSPKLESTQLVPPLIDLPPSWRWSRLLDLGEINPRNQVEEDSESVIMATFVPMAAVSELHSIAIAGDVRPWSEIKKGYTHFANGDVLLAKITPCFENGKSAVVRGLEHNIGSGSTEFHVFRPISEDVNPAYIYLFIRSPLFRAKGEASMTGTAGQKRLPTDYFALCAMPFPPTEEQSRIVAKVDELMALCDQLEVQQQKRRTLQNNLRQSILQAVAASQSSQELKESWQRLQTNFGQLFSTPEDVAQLRALILDLAVHGLLVERSNVDTPLDTWLEQVKTTKAHLVKQKLIPKQTAFSNVPEEEYPFPLPKGWAFVRLGEIANKIGSGSTPRGGRKVYVNKGIPFLRSQNIWNNGLRLDDVAYIPAEVHERMSGTAVAANDVLLNITGASLGRCALVPADFGEANVSQHVTIIRLTDVEIREYIHLCILSPYTQAMIWGRQVGMAREGLSKKVLEQFEIPLPPIAEQKRIVARVAELMKFCDTLESKLHRTLVVSEHLATASVATLTGIATEQEEEPMKAPKTELVAPVRLGTPPGIKSQAPLATILARHSGEMSAKDLWQRFGGEIDAFYAQLKVEVAHGWILEPEKAEMLEKIEE
ncbi:restriction endonuclease subunit S [Bowmanella yangjiangensis]|uniref:Restriction endonuclease subunit S n=1 Tax=Bowmanella yangjiangensis TaxID=2811230 RepID=A0ABS3CMY5_9ALTE|nr:restriction endonuclease subunit S [Bowmanella yangjiangensis]MBN7818482.1 restriction endonuclease subunit S [Bowmanella yangjiangensis]